MDQALGFLRALADDPCDDTTWLVYADWLEDRGDQRAEFIRLTVALGQGVIDQVLPTMNRLDSLRRMVDPDWLGQLVRLRAGRPMRFRIDNVILIGDATSEDGMSVVQGVLESGTIRVGDKVRIPLEYHRSVITDEVIQMWAGSKHDYQQLSAGQEPLYFNMFWPGCPLRILRHGVIIPVG